MNSLKFSTNDVTHEEAKVIADAYFRSGQDLHGMKKILGTNTLSSEILNHPLVKKEIMVLQADLNEGYSLKDHLQMLKDIRNGAMEDENWKVALSAEVAVGKAAGLYEPKKPEEDPADKVDPTKLSSAELRKRLALSAPDASDVPMIGHNSDEFPDEAF